MRRITIPSSTPRPRPCAGRSPDCGLPGRTPASKSFRVGDVSFVRELLLVDVYADDRAGAIRTRTLWRRRPGARFPGIWSCLWRRRSAAAGRRSRKERRCAATSNGSISSARTNSSANSCRWSRRSSATHTGRPRCDPLVTADEARKRWAALAAFYQEHGHFLVTNGPYRLVKWSSSGRR